MIGHSVRDINGILLLYDRPLRADAHAHLEHIGAFGKYSAFPAWEVNAHLGFPPGLSGLRFRVVILHYTLFGGWCWPAGLPAPFLRYLDAEARDSYKVAFFQDEYRHCQARFAFLDAHEIDCVYTLLDPPYHDRIYGQHTRVRTVESTLTGYVSDELVARAAALTRPDGARTIDVGYRARRLDTAMGRAALEKSAIADEFVRRAAGSTWRLDIATDEGRRIYGADWWRFLANCRGMLGAESGVSIFDLHDEVWTEYRRLKRSGVRGEPQLPQALLDAWEDYVPYRIISPRHFEAAAFHVCQILFEGRYSTRSRPARTTWRCARTSRTLMRSWTHSPIPGSEPT